MFGYPRLHKPTFEQIINILRQFKSDRNSGSAPGGSSQRFPCCYMSGLLKLQHVWSLSQMHEHACPANHSTFTKCSHVYKYQKAAVPKTVRRAVSGTWPWAKCSRHNTCHCPCHGLCLCHDPSPAPSLSLAPFPAPFPSPSFLSPSHAPSRVPCPCPSLCRGSERDLCARSGGCGPRGALCGDPLMLIGTSSCAYRIR